MASSSWPCYPRGQEVITVPTSQNWLDTLLDNPIAQLLAFTLTFILRIEIDRWLRKRDTKRQKKRKGHSPA